MFRHAQIHFTADISSLSDRILSQDSDSMQSATINLCLNALQAAGPHGTARLQAFSQGCDAEISVSDSGPGPAESVAGSLFEPFVTTKPEGVGLGLVHVKQAAREAGGSVDWHREHGLTIFVIKLPEQHLVPTTSKETPSVELVQR
jgi:C4-dicarboxylate-specific signal transduction histidine kinase